MKNIVEPVRVYSLEGAATAKPLTPPPPHRAPAPLAAGLLLLALALAFSGYWRFGRAPQVGDAGHLSIVVLPFTNLSGDAAQDYFADGVTESLTADLARIKGSFVIAFSTAVSFKNKAVDVRQIGRELGVRYLLEGSVQRDRNRVRVNAELIATQSGAHLWAGRFDEDLGELLRLQDQIVSQLSNNLGAELIIAEAARAARASNPDAVDLTMRAEALLLQFWELKESESRQATARARELFAKALQLDPNQPDALAGTALSNAIGYGWDWKNPLIDYADYRQGEDPDVIAYADKALKLAPENVTAALAKGLYYNFSHLYDDALRALDAGLARNPNSALLLAARVNVLNAFGRYEEAKADALLAMRLSPHDLQISAWNMALGDAELGLGHYEAAVERYRQDLEGGGRIERYLDIAAVRALQGDMDAAKSALQKARPAYRELTIKALRKKGPNIDIWYDGLRKAGVPEE